MPRKKPRPAARKRLAKLKEKMTRNKSFDRRASIWLEQAAPITPAVLAASMAALQRRKS